MRANRQFKLSEQAEKNIRKAVSEFGKDLKGEMECASVDHLKISLDLNFGSTGKFMGVKISAMKFEEMNLLYDQEVK